jgi:DNA-binding NtrC family response regulator
MGAALRVLVADDEPKIRRLLQQILEGKGCQVCLAEDGLEALTQFQAQPCDVVITDIRMPKVTGLELLVELKRLDPLVHVVVITSYPSVEGAVEAMKIGACDFITKPFDLAQIQAILYRAQQRLSLSKQLRTTGEGALKLEELNRRLAELNDLKSRFLATLSHGINTPLCLMGSISSPTGRWARSRRTNSGPSRSSSRPTSGSSGCWSSSLISCTATRSRCGSTR